MKKTIVLFLSILLALSFLLTTYADNYKEPIQELSNAKYLNLLNVSASLDISGNTAYCTGFAKSIISTDTIKITMLLQKQTSTGWITIASWYKQGLRLVTLDNNKGGLSTGTYRVLLYIRVYDINGSLVEFTNVYSKLKVIA